MMVSILGDSISTFEGYHPVGCAVFYDRTMQAKNGLRSVYDTWWAKVNQALHAYLCVNNSYSGSKVSGADFPAASSAQRTGKLHTAKYAPDLILIYIGFNDFANGVKIREGGLGRFLKSDPRCFEDAYRKMVSGIKQNYPKATIVCATLMRTKIRGAQQWVFPETHAGVPFESYNDSIRRICRRENCCLADLAALDLRYETLDGTHPTAQGHAVLSQAWIRCLSEQGLL